MLLTYRILCVLSYILFYAFAYSQITFKEVINSHRTKFENFKSEKQQEFKTFRDSINGLYGKEMRIPWDEHDTQPAAPAPPSPKPPIPEEAALDELVTNDPLPFISVTPLPNPKPRPVPLLPISPVDNVPDNAISSPSVIRSIPEKAVNPAQPKLEPTAPSMPQLTFDFYGSACNVPFDESLQIRLLGLDENSVADAWNLLASDKSLDLIKCAIGIRNKMILSDWGYIRLVENLADTAFPNNNNESKLLQMFILTQSGYKVRLGRRGDKLLVLVPSDDRIYNYSYIIIEGQCFYAIDRNAGNGSTYVFNRKFPREQMFSMSFDSQPLLHITPTQKKHFQCSYGLGIDIDISVNKNLIYYYNEYPLSSSWNINANASLSQDVKDQLYPKLRDAIDGKSEAEAANILLRFVQNAFKYKTDEEQFGYERSFFPDEIFFYPYSDCEDRAILYSVLVRELLGLNVVLLYYPGHLATAVHFNEPVKGDYFNIEDNKFTVCDPTYINSNIGMSMPQYKNASAEIIKLN